MSVTQTNTMASDSGSPDTDDLAASLRLIPLFESLDDRLSHAVASITQETRLAAGQEIFQQGSRPRCLYALLEGQVALWTTAPDDSRAAVEVVRAPGYFVLATVLTGLPHLMTAQAVTPVHLLMIDAEGLSDLVSREVVLANALLRAEALNFRLLVRQVQDLKLRTAAQRLGCFLLALADNSEANTAQIRLPFDKRLLAARLGCRQENLSRAFATLRSFGVETHGARVLLHDVPALRGFAVPDESADPGATFSG